MSLDKLNNASHRAKKDPRAQGKLAAALMSRRAHPETCCIYTLATEPVVLEGKTADQAHAGALVGQQEPESARGSSLPTQFKGAKTGLRAVMRRSHHALGAWPVGFHHTPTPPCERASSHAQPRGMGRGACGRAFRGEHGCSTSAALGPWAVVQQAWHLNRQRGCCTSLCWSRGTARRRWRRWGRRCEGRRHW